MRQDLAALYRLATHYGWTDVTSTHISARLPDDPARYLLNSHDLMFDEITASNLTAMRFSGEQEAEGASAEPGGPYHPLGHLDGATGCQLRHPQSYPRRHRRLRHVRGDCCRSPSTRASSWARCRAIPIKIRPRWPTRGALLAADLMQNFAMLLQNHGLLVVGRTAAEAFTYHYYLEMACKIQVDILSSSEKPIFITDDAMAALHAWGDPREGPKGAHQWPALLRMLDRTCPEYRN